MDGPKIDRLYYSSKEVCQDCQVQPFILRAWESTFPFIRPQKTKSGRKKYRPKDLEIIKQIKKFKDNGYDDDKILSIFRNKKNAFVMQYENKRNIKNNKDYVNPIPTGNFNILDSVKKSLLEILDLLDHN